jgi:hypothetical protein
MRAEPWILFLATLRSRQLQHLTSDNSLYARVPAVAHRVAQAGTQYAALASVSRNAGVSKMPHELLQNELRLRARELISHGRLPRHHPSRIWGGSGTGDQICSLCSRPIARDEVEYELEYNAEAAVRMARFHFLCHAAWQLECARG